MEGLPRRHRDPGHRPAGGADGAAGSALTLAPLELRAEPLDGATAVDLLRELDDDLMRRYGEGEAVHAVPEQFLSPHGGFFVAYRAGRPIGCAGFRRIDPAIAELKRMYVRPHARGTGVAKALLRHVEDAAASAGYSQLWLETGLEQPEAMALYAAAGYVAVPPFGQYAAFPSSRCFGKPLREPGAPVTT